MKSLEEDMVAMNSRQEDEKKQMQKSLHAKLSERKRKAIAEQVIKSIKQQQLMANISRRNLHCEVSVKSKALLRSLGESSGKNYYNFIIINLIW